MTYDQWKTRSPDDDAPVCDLCGGWLHRGTCSELWCPDCEDEAHEQAEMLTFYRWEPQ